MSEALCILQVESATVQFGGVKAVDDVSLRVSAGEVLGLVGPNGAGKSTLFAAMAGAAPLRSGRIILSGKDVTGLAPNQMSRYGIARTFQKVHLFESMTAFENVLVAAMAHRQQGARPGQVAEAALAASGFFSSIHRPAKELALAERKRIEIARALATSPRLLLMDEMMNGLTRAETAELVKLVEDLSNRGITVLLVEHIMPVVRALCTRMIVLHHGRSIAEGPPEQVLAQANVQEAYLGPLVAQGLT